MIYSSLKSMLFIKFSFKVQSTIDWLPILYYYFELVVPPGGLTITKFIL